MFSDEDADLAIVQQRNVAVLGFGARASAQALSLRDSGVDVRVGVPESAAEREEADAEGLRVLPPYAACEEADLVVMLAPAAVQEAVYVEAVQPNLVAGDAVLFGTGFDVAFGRVAPPAGVDVCLVAPQAPAAALRREFESGRGVPVLVAVEQDASGAAWDLTLSYAKAIGGTRAGALRTTFAEAAEVAVFAEQVAGGVQALVRAGFEVLLEAGYQPEAAYLQCSAALRTVGEGTAALSGPSGPPAAPGFAEYARLVAGARLADHAVRKHLSGLLSDTLTGELLRAFTADLGNKAPMLTRLRSRVARGPSATTARDVRALLGWQSPPDGGGTDADKDGDVKAWLS